MHEAFGERFAPVPAFPALRPVGPQGGEGILQVRGRKEGERRPCGVRSDGTPREWRPGAGGDHPGARAGNAERSGARGGGGDRTHAPRRRRRRHLRLRVPAVPRWPAATRRRPRRRAHRGRARAPRRTLRRPVRAVRCAARPGAAQREVLSLVPGTRHLALMLRAGLLWLSEQPRVFRFIRGNGLARRFAARFVAGETVGSGVAGRKSRNAAGLTASLDLLGESVHNAAEAQAARDTYLETLDPIKTTGADANVSVKLTQMGLDIDEALCVENMRAIIARAKAYGSFVR